MFNNEQQAYINLGVMKLLSLFTVSEFKHIVDFKRVEGLDILTRDQLRRIKMEGVYECRSSGSTGEPVTVKKTLEDMIWHLATNIREYHWRGWDFAKNIAVIKPGITQIDIKSWGLPKYIAPNQGYTYKIGCKPIKELQKWLEERNPHYLFCLPSIRDMLELSKLTNFEDWKGTGELGGTCYSSEECGTIAIQCPDYKHNYHVMENQIVELDNDGGMIISTFSNPYIRRYKHGDHIELGSCRCGRSLQTITKIFGRRRNMVVLENGDRKWPLIGSHVYYEKHKIKRYKMIQRSLKDFEIRIICEHHVDHNLLRNDIEAMLGFSINLHIVYVDTFDEYKFEEFVSLI